MSFANDISLSQANSMRLCLHWKSSFDCWFGSRIGRTGRAGAAGMAFSFFTAANARLAKPIKLLLEDGKRPVPAQLSKYAEITGGLGAGIGLYIAKSHPHPSEHAT